MKHKLNQWTFCRGCSGFYLYLFLEASCKISFDVIELSVHFNNDIIMGYKKNNKTSLSADKTILSSIFSLLFRYSLRVWLKTSLLTGLHSIVLFLGHFTSIQDLESSVILYNFYPYPWLPCW